MLSSNISMEALEYCRICTRRNLRLIAISKEIQSDFLSVTQLELIKTFALSSLICQTCEKHLRNTRKYRDGLLTTERKLQQELNLIQRESILLVDKTNDSCSFTIERVIDTEDLITEEHFDLIEEESVIDPMLLDDNLTCEDEKIEVEEESFKKVEVIKNDLSAKRQSINSKETFQPIRTRLKRKLKSKPLKLTTINGKTVCPHCNRSVIKAYIKHHIARLHYSVKNYTCDLCNREFYKKSALTAHMNTHLDTRPFECTHDNCSKSFASLTALGTHIRFHHTSFHPHICSECGKGYKQKRLLEEHVRSQHTGERIFKCNFEGCDAGFFSHGALRKHLAKCHENKPSTCEICGKTFKALTNLQAHKRLSHSKVTVACDFPGCGKQFPSRCFLENHKKRHDDIRDYKCEQCDKTFLRRTHLVRHVESIHSKIQNVLCGVENCGKNLCRLENYKNHLKRVHKHLDKIEIERLMEDAKSRCDELVEYEDYEVLDEELIEDEIIVGS